MHPKSIVDLEVTDTELDEARTAHFFFIQGLLTLLEGASEAYRKRAEQVQRRGQAAGALAKRLKDRKRSPADPDVKK